MTPEAFAELATFGQNVPGWLASRRQEAQNKYLSDGLPSRRHEKWRYTSLKDLANTKFDWSHARGLVHGNEVRDHIQAGSFPLVFVDGVFDSSFCDLDQLPAGLTITPLHKAFGTHEEPIKQFMAKFPGKHAFELLNDAFTYSGLYLDVAPGTTLEQPLHVLFVNTQKPKPYCLFPRLFMRFGTNARADVLTTSIGHSHEGCYLTSLQLDAHLAPGAQLRQMIWQNDSDNAYSFMSSHLQLERDARFEAHYTATGGRLSRYQCQVDLNGPGAETNLAGLYAVSGDRQADVYVNVSHNAPYCQSHQLFKGLLADSSRGVFSGCIKVIKDAQQTASTQLNQNLLLGDQAEINTQPQLEIDADDVKCSHGAAIGQLDPEDLFYLQSRGISQESARVMLAKAFVNDVLNRGYHEGFSSRVLTRVDQLLATSSTPNNGGKLRD